MKAANARARHIPAGGGLLDKPGRTYGGSD